MQVSTANKVQSLVWVFGSVKLRVLHLSLSMSVLFSPWAGAPLLYAVVQHPNPIETNCGLHHSVWRRLSNRSCDVSGPVISQCIELNHISTWNKYLNVIYILNGRLTQIHTALSPNAGQWSVTQSLLLATLAGGIHRAAPLKVVNGVICCIFPFENSSQQELCIIQNNRVHLNFFEYLYSVYQALLFQNLNKLFAWPAVP